MTVALVTAATGPALPTTGRRAPTSHDVAEEAGLSQSTVSRALRGDPGHHRHEHDEGDGEFHADPDAITVPFRLRHHVAMAQHVTIRPALPDEHASVGDLVAVADAGGVVLGLEEVACFREGLDR